MNTPDSQKYLRLTKDTILRILEKPYLYNKSCNELYEIDNSARDLILKCDGTRTLRELAPPDDFFSYCIEEGLLELHSESCRINIPVGNSPEHSLRYLEAQITYRCNLRCRHCYLGTPSDTDINPELLISILEEFDAMQGLVLILSGGEPLLYPALKHLMKELPRFAFRKVLLTNGLFVEKSLQDLTVDEIQFSIDGLEEAHDFLRGRGTFKKIVQAMKEAKKAGFDISVSTMIHKANVNDFDCLKSLLENLGIIEWGIDVPISTGRFAEHPEDIVDLQTAAKLLSYSFGGGYHGSGEGYACGHHLLSIFPDGNAAKCGFYTDDLYGNISEGLRTVWSRASHLKTSDLHCHCEFKEECRGGCRFRAALFGDPLGSDPVMCSVFGVSL